MSCVLALAAGLVAAAPAAAADHVIAFASYAYNPPDITIAPGDTATFNGSFADHPLVWDGDQFVTTTGGASQQFAFSAPGTYAYHCQFHVGRGMKGVVRVLGNQHPAHVAFAATPTAPAVGEAVTFTYTGDPDPDGTLVRWEWDLDGDGTFETSTTVPSTSRAYAAPGTITVRMRAIDNGNEASATAEQPLTIAAAAMAESLDRTAPRASKLALQGLTLRFRTTERASATAAVRRGKSTLAKGSAGAGKTTIRLRLTKAGKRVLKRGHRIKATIALTLRDAAGNARTTKRVLTVRRR